MVLLQIPAIKPKHTIAILIFETMCLWAFGIAWLTKGEFILKDGKVPRVATPKIDTAAGTQQHGVTV